LEFERDQYGNIYQKMCIHGARNEELAATTDIYKNYLQKLSRAVGVEIKFLTYSELQATPEFRQAFLNTLYFYNQLGAINPGVEKLKIRFAGSDGYAEKSTLHTSLLEFGNDYAVFKSKGLNGEDYSSLVTPDNGDSVYLDLNTLARNLVSSTHQCRQYKDDNVISATIKGRDWITAVPQIEL
jgi:hypothetical protein